MQEFILLSDVLGLSLLVDSIDHPKPPLSTEGTVLGPFHTHEAKNVDHGDLVHNDPEGEPLLVLCTVKDTAGNLFLKLRLIFGRLIRLATMTSNTPREMAPTEEPCSKPTRMVPSGSMRLFLSPIPSHMTALLANFSTYCIGTRIGPVTSTLCLRNQVMIT
jgi:hypothetical protein